MKQDKEIKDDEIRIIKSEGKTTVRSYKWWIVGGIFIVLIIGISYIIITKQNDNSANSTTTAETADAQSGAAAQAVKPIGHSADSHIAGFCEIRDTTINDIPIRVFVPHNAQMSLHLGALQKDSNIVYATRAADIRSDNGHIVGAFVLKGELLSRGKAKKGYCASINGKVTIGVAENTSLLEEATENDGYFFRQYPLVDNGRLVDNAPKGKSIRRGICDRQGEIFMVETLTSESFHDFAQALVDLGVDNAIYLCGSETYGWAIDENKNILELGDGKVQQTPNTSYIIWRRK